MYGIRKQFLYIIQSEKYSAMPKGDVWRYEIAPNVLIPILHQCITSNGGEQKINAKPM